MHTDEVWQAIDTQRLRVADMLEKLADDEWRTPSLCGGWTVRDVAAHLTMQQTGPGEVLRMAARAPGGMKRVIHRSACLRTAVRRRGMRPARQARVRPGALMTIQTAPRTRLSGFSQAELDAVAAEVNGGPRKVPGRKTPQKRTARHSI